jgi:xylan 1,4-beta-xylosidase
MTFRPPGATWDRPAQVTRAQVASLRRASSGEPVVDEEILVNKDRVFVRNFELRANAVWFINPHSLR